MELGRGGVELHGARRGRTGPHWKGKFNCMELERVELDYMY